MSKRYDKTMKTAWERACEFNDKYPVGTKVLYKPGIDQSEIMTVTRTAAWVNAAGVAVVMIEGRTDGVSITAIRKNDG